MAERRYTVEAVGPRIDTFLRGLLKSAHFRVELEIVEGHNPHPEIEDPEVLVRFSGPDVEVLLNNRAELLLALEHVTMEMLRMPPEDHSRLCFDAEDYRVLRIEELRLSASAAAEKVQRTGRPFVFNPMTSRERRIIHLALRDETGVRSESAGVGPHRQVVIYPASMPSQPDVTAFSAPQPPPRRSRRR